MLGAIAGDIIGSVYEFRNIHNKEFPLFTNDSHFTDDTVLTVALADSIINDKDWLYTIHEYAERYPKCGFGGFFRKWVKEKNREPYNSYGNGSAMRVSPIYWLYDEIDMLDEAKRSAEVTHNHPEGIKGAQALIYTMHLASKDLTIVDIEKKLKKYYYIPTTEETNVLYKVLSKNDKHLMCSCQHTVPQAINSFLESESFEETIRNAISLGGDSDTIACMAGSIAEVAWEVPKDIKKEVRKRLNKHLLKILDQFMEFVE